MQHWLPPVVAFLFIFGMLAALVVWRLRMFRSRRGRYSFGDRPEAAPSGEIFDFSDIRCGHPLPSAAATVTVFGTPVGTLGPDAPICAACMQTWLERHSTRCASCGGPICPGMPVGQAWVGAPYQHTHMNFDCTESGGLWCGRWGRGRLVTLHEIDPEKYAPGTANAMAHVLRTGKPSVDDIR
ncbi:MAG: hypothetical protein RL272_917 [Candidatus Parcubacteria bacterium]|jgi:hypothetical protein